MKINKKWIIGILICISCQSFAATYIDGKLTIQGIDFISTTNNIGNISNELVSVTNNINCVSNNFINFVNSNYVSIATSITMNISATNISLPISYKDVMIARGRFYAIRTNVFSKTVTITLYTKNDYKGSNTYWRANVYLVSVPLSGTHGAATNILNVSDSSGIMANDLLFLTESNEFCRVSNVVGNAVYLEDTTVFGHSSTCNVSRVSEYGGFSSIDLTNTSNIWMRISATNTINQTLKNDILYRR